VAVAGGVAANSALRRAVIERSPAPVRYPPPKYCTDNAAMIAGCAYFHLARGERSELSLDVQPNLRFA
jgi:N6-L-threonylcarbamoyladenine synthase